MKFPYYILSMACVSGDDVQVRINHTEDHPQDILRWLKSLDHEGSSWTVHEMKTKTPDSSTDITEAIEQEYRA